MTINQLLNDHAAQFNNYEGYCFDLAFSDGNVARCKNINILREHYGEYFGNFTSFHSVEQMKEIKMITIENIKEA